MKRAIALFICLTGSISAHGSPLTPNEVLNYIQAKGSQPAREKYFSCWEKGNAEGYARVEGGSSEWLRVAVKLLQDADACYSESLKDSIARALMTQPENVLPLVDSGNRLEASSICVPFMTDEVESDKLRAQLDTLSKLERSLKRISNPALQIPKMKCLALIRPLKKDVETALNHR